MQSYPIRALDRRLQVDWVKDAREDCRCNCLWVLRFDSREESNNVWEVEVEVEGEKHHYVSDSFAFFFFLRLEDKFDPILRIAFRWKAHQSLWNSRCCWHQSIPTTELAPFLTDSPPITLASPLPPKSLGLISSSTQSPLSSAFPTSLFFFSLLKKLIFWCLIPSFSSFVAYPFARFSQQFRGLLFFLIEIVGFFFLFFKLMQQMGRFIFPPLVGFCLGYLIRDIWLCNFLWWSELLPAELRSSCLGILVLFSSNQN